MGGIGGCGNDGVSDSGYDDGSGYDGGCGYDDVDDFLFIVIGKVVSLNTLDLLPRLIFHDLFYL